VTGSPAAASDSAADIPDTDGNSNQFTLRRIVQNRSELEHFRAFLTDHMASTDLNCWLDIDSLRHVATADRPQRDERVQLVVRKYFNNEYFYGLASPASEQEQSTVCFVSLMSVSVSIAHHQWKPLMANVVFSTFFYLKGTTGSA